MSDVAFFINRHDFVMLDWFRLFPSTPTCIISLPVIATRLLNLIFSKVFFAKGVFGIMKQFGVLEIKVLEVAIAIALFSTYPRFQSFIKNV